MNLGNVISSQFDSSRRNVNNTERWISGAAALAALVFAGRRRGLGRWALLGTGLSLLKRGATGRCEMYSMLGIDTCHRDTQPSHNLKSRENVPAIGVESNRNEATNTGLASGGLSMH